MNASRNEQLAGCRAGGRAEGVLGGVLGLYFCRRTYHWKECRCGGHVRMAPGGYPAARLSGHRRIQGACARDVAPVYCC
jgi:hypothetical protein